jgi:hypothetical protein
MLTQVIPEFFGDLIVFREQRMNLWASPVPTTEISTIKQRPRIPARPFPRKWL